MANVTRNFDALTGGSEKPTFQMGGQVFTARARLPFRKFTALLQAGTAEGAEEAELTERFFGMVLVPADRDRFLALLNDDGDEDDEKVIGAEQISACTEWLMEFYTGKLREKSDSSSSGAPGPPPSSKVVSLTPRAGKAAAG